MATLHELDVDADGGTVTRHPDSDVPDCGFEAYVERDWTGESVARPSRWDFVRREMDGGGIDWLGTRLDTPPPLAAQGGES